LINLFKGIWSILIVSFCLYTAEKINLLHQTGFRGFFYSILCCSHGNGSKIT